MISYIEYSNSINEAKLTHLEHIEDVIFISKDKMLEALDTLENMITQLSTDMKVKEQTIVQLKFDGSPAIIAGTDPQNHKFFVATKSLFNKTPKINYTEEDIKKNHSGQLVDILVTSLKYLKNCIPKNKIYQMDFMYSQKSLHKKDNMITFQPNTIVYGIPLNDPLAEKIMSKKIGIAVHTEYIGTSINDLSAVPITDIDDFNDSDVFVINNTITGINGLFSKQEVNTYYKQLEDLKNDVKKIKDSDYKIIKMYQRELKTFINSLVKNNKNIYEITQNSIKYLINFLNTKEKADELKYKTQRGKDKNKLKYKKIKSDIRSCASSLYHIFIFQKNLVFLKEQIINKMNMLSKFNTFVQKGDRLEVTNPEGFVLINNKKDMFKLVSRLEFSKNNFIRNK